MRVVILASAERDLTEVRRYILDNFSHNTWLKTFGKLKESIRHLATFPQLGAVPAELERLNLTQYWQILSGMNRVIYETRQDTVYIHIIVDVHRDIQAFLLRRLVRWRPSRA